MDFMTPEEKLFYPSGTVLIPVLEDPTIVERTYYVESIIHFSLRFDPETERIFLLERHIVSDDYQGPHKNGTG
jgi:hypothetical protein